MSNLQQAPAIKYNGDKNKTSQEAKNWGKAIRTHELETKIMCGLGGRDMVPLKVMLFLTGNAEGFRVAEKTICERCNISTHKAYIDARQKLREMGWISYGDGFITVNYDVILGYSQNTSKDEGYSQNTSKEAQKNETYFQNTSMTYFQNTSETYSQNTYNNISEYDKEYDNSCAPGLAADAANRSQAPLPDVKEVKEVSLERAKSMWGNTFTVDEGGIVVFSADNPNVNKNGKFRIISQEEK